MSYCPKCGSEIREGHKFCTKCGFQVGVVKDDDSVSFWIKIFVLVFLGMVVLGIMFAIALALIQNNDGSRDARNETGITIGPKVDSNIKYIPTTNAKPCIGANILDASTGRVEKTLCTDKDGKTFYSFCVDDHFIMRYKCDKQGSEECIQSFDECYYNESCVSGGCEPLTTTAV